MSKETRQAAFDILARRDHSRQELKSKLLNKGFELEQIEQTLDLCESRGYLDDVRYGELLLRSHIAKGHGIVRIKQAFIQKGLAKDVITTVLEQSDCDWFELAREKAIRKYGTPKTSDPKEKAKRIRHLMGQGFAYDQIAYALDYDPYLDE